MSEQPAKAAQICDECSRRLEDGALYEDHSPSGTVKQGRRPMFKSFKQQAEETAAELERVKGLNSELARWVKGHMDSAGFTARRKAEELIAKAAQVPAKHLEQACDTLDAYAAELECVKADRELARGVCRSYLKTIEEFAKQRDELLATLKAMVACEAGSTTNAVKLIAKVEKGAK